MGYKKLVKYSFLIIALLLTTPAWCDPYRVSAWTFGDRASLKAAADRAAIDEVNVDWYISKPDLSIQGDGVDTDFVAVAKARGVRVLATVSNWSEALGDFDPDLAHGILATKTSTDQHIQAIVKLCQEGGYDGIDLDWEALYPSDRNRFTHFVAQLAQKLHASRKLLSIAVHAKESEPGNWEGPRAQDWKKLGAAVDEFKIMTYDYSGPWSDPGPIGPPDWTDAVLTHAEALVPQQKIMMGVPFYGYDWQPQSCIDVDWKSATSRARSHHSAINHDPSGEATFTYVDNLGKSHTVFFQDRTAIAAKLRMLLQKHPGIRGIAIWRMGGESPAFWNEIVLKLR